MIADANGTVYAVDLQTNDLVALNGLTGSQLWRQHFDYPTFALSPPLLGDDGSLYVTAGATLYKSGPGANCTPPRFIFTDATGAAGFADIGVSNQRLDQGELKGDVRIENDLHVWLGVASIAADPGDSARLVPNLNAGVEGVAATFGLVPPCTGISLHTSCPNPGSAGWTSSFCSRGVVEIHTQLTVASGLSL
jgi:hypothetical protein